MEPMMRPRVGRQLGRFRHPQRRFRAGLVQLLCVLAGLGLGLLLPRITTEPSVASTRVTEALTDAVPEPALSWSMWLIRRQRVRACRPGGGAAPVGLPPEGARHGRPGSDSWPTALPPWS